MKVGWLADDPGYVGGAELTQAEFLAAAPVDVVRCRPGDITAGLDRYVAHNVIHYSLSEIRELENVVWYHHDLSRQIDPEVKTHLDAHADHIFCSPLHRDHYGLEGKCIPPAMDLERFKAPRQSARRREGVCSVAQWRNPGKGAQYVEEWAKANSPVDVYGPGVFVPEGPELNFCGPVMPDKVIQTLWQYERFVFLPFEVEPFCRTVVEAWAAGCEVIINDLIGARHYIEDDPGALESAAEDFWKVVCD